MTTSPATATIADPRANLPAARRGVTPLQASALFGRPLREVLAVYVWGKSKRVAPIGRIDAFNCWWADRRDVEAVFAGSNQRCADAPPTPAWQDKTLARMARRLVVAARA